MKKTILILILIIFSSLGATNMSQSTENNNKKINKKIEKAVVAGGCFWCVEADLQKLDGVIEAVSGYTGGEVENPTYEQVSTGTTGHYEAVEITYDANVISYAEILKYFMMHHDPTDAGGSFGDRGTQYQSAIFYKDEYQYEVAMKVLDLFETIPEFKDKIVTRLIPLKKFYVAEDYHQNFCDINPTRYKSYRAFSGRDSYIEKNWGKLVKDLEPLNNRLKATGTKEDLKKKLTPMQFEVVCNSGTEPAFNNKYWDNKAEGLYVDVVSGEPLFSSTKKFDSATGWPSFTEPVNKENIVEVEDNKFFMSRIEVRSKEGDSHLGHVFDDGPNGNRRYCINSASLRFIPKDKLIDEGYGEYLKLF